MCKPSKLMILAALSKGKVLPSHVPDLEEGPLWVVLTFGKDWAWAEIGQSGMPLKASIRLDVPEHIGVKTAHRDPDNNLGSGVLPRRDRKHLWRAVRADCQTPRLDRLPGDW